MTSIHSNNNMPTCNAKLFVAVVSDSDKEPSIAWRILLKVCNLQKAGIMGKLMSWLMKETEESSFSLRSRATCKRAAVAQTIMLRTGLRKVSRPASGRASWRRAAFLRIFSSPTICGLKLSTQVCVFLSQMPLATLSGVRIRYTPCMAATTPSSTPFYTRRTPFVQAVSGPATISLRRRRRRGPRSPDLAGLSPCTSRWSCTAADHSRAGAGTASTSRCGAGRLAGSAAAAGESAAGGEAATRGRPYRQQF